MTKEEITQRSFASKVRGVSETEVRTFLKRIADEFEQLTGREDTLLSRVADLEKQLNEKPKVSKQELLENLGEETARVLSSAEEAAEKMLKEAKEESDRLISEATSKADEIVTGAKAQSEQKMSETQARVKSLQESAQRNAETIIEESRTRGREIHDETVVVREKILKDLLRRRDLLLEQIDELRKGREELLESYKTVKNSFQKATDALQSVETKASSELMSNPIDVDELLKSPVQLPELLNPSNNIDPGKPIVIDQSASQSEQSQESAESSADVSAQDESKEDSSNETNENSSESKGKFSRYMKDALGVGDDGAEVASTVTPIPKEPVKAIDIKEDVKEKVQEKAEEDKSSKKDVNALFKSLKQQSAESEDDSDDKAVETEVKDEIKESAKDIKKEKKSEKKSKKKSAIDLRNDFFDEVTTGILRKAKRQLQDEQNEVLEALRTTKSKKKLSAEAVLIDIETHEKVWTELLREDLEKVFSAGAKTVSKKSFTYSDDALHFAINWITASLRETISLAIDEGDQAEASTRVGARYREWRNNDLKGALFDSMSAAYNNGVVVAADGSTLNWKVEKAGRCPDCDDNSLEATSAGETFPTGQIAPPAHTGCKCVLTVA